MEQWHVTLWIRRVSFVIAFCLSSYVLKKELFNRRREKSSAVSSNSNIYQKLLNLWSLLTMILMLFIPFLFLIGTLPSNICEYVWRLGNISWLSSRITLTFYQISRLQYCFLDKQIHSKKYGYPQCLFYLLYLIGIICGLYTCLFWWFIPNDTYDINKQVCIREYSDFYSIYLVTSSLVYFGWDWLVLSLYIIKIIQIKNKKTSSNDKNNTIVTKRIAIILHKIVLLTIIYEITGMLEIIFITIIDESTIIGSILKIPIYLDPVIISAVMYLMIERNHQQYLKVLNIMYKSKICCCFNCLMIESINTIDEQNTAANIQEENNKNEKNICHTKESKENSIQLQQKKYIDLSEQTITVVNI